MKNVYIKEPIWHSQSIGVDRKWITDDLAIEIVYETKDGTRLFPDVYRITKWKALSYPIQKESKVKLHIIPIADLEIETPEEKEKREYLQTMGL